jgi:hypothetical protein
MKRVLMLVLIVAQAVALPLQGEETSLLQESAGLFPQADDDSTVESEVNAAIEGDVNLDNMGQDMGESMHEKASTWEKKAMADISAMSRNGMKKVHVATNDPLTAQFEADAEKAKMAVATPKQQKVSRESEIEREADEALKDPKKARELEAMATKAELDLQTTMPDAMSFIQEGSNDDEDDENFTDDEDDVPGLSLMSGSDEDVEKAIMGQISQQVNTRLGSIPVDTGSSEDFKQFTEDKEEAAQFVDTEKNEQKQAAAKKQIAKAMKEAQQALSTSQASVEETKAK